MSIACLCWLRGNSVCTRFTHVCPCHAWGALMEQLMRMHGWQSTGADIAFIEKVRRCSCSCRCENFLSRNSRPFCSLSTSSMTTSLELCGSASQRDCGVFAAACPTAIQGAPPAGFYRCVLACHASLALPKHLMVERTHSVSLHTHAQDDVHAARRYSFASLIVQWVVLIGWINKWAQPGAAICSGGSAN